MHIVEADRGRGKNRFAAVGESFLQQPGLPFAQVLTAEAIEEAFIRNDSLFAQEDVFSTQLVLWAFLAQVLRDGKGAACSAAVADIATCLQQTGRPAPSGDTGDYCRARAKLSLTALQELTAQAACQMEQAADPSWLWHGMHAKLIDGFTFTMPDTPANQRAFPQPKSQKPGVGFPIARACAVLSLATAAICQMKIGRYQGKETGESALLREILSCLEGGDLAVLDRYYCSFMLLAMLRMQGVHFCARLHQRRSSDFRRGKRLGQDDHLITWTRPVRPDWMSEELYAQIPATMTLREVRLTIAVPGRRSQTLTVVTSLIDPQAFTPQDIAALYGLRWNAELDIRNIKQTLGLDHVRCKTPNMVNLELWTTLLAYNLIRRLTAIAAAVHEKQPRQLSFTFACQTVLSSWMLLATGACRDAASMWRQALSRIAANQVANRPDRIEPRVIKRRRHHYPLMRQPRQALKHAP